MFAHPAPQINDQRGAALLAHGPAPLGRRAVDAALELKQGIDPADCFQRQWRDHRWFFALQLAARILRQIGDHVEADPSPRSAPTVRPPRRIATRRPP
ncbi:hypothetical protein XH97_02485 [Bradyrhizobium sp. CCBAU 53380]|nr:hypothetical protein [Bradyrhizobium sp. CCBAU 53380]